MPDVRQGLRHAPTAAQRQNVTGVVSAIRPAPTTFDDPVWVIAPGYSADVPLGPCSWGAIHGATKPIAGTEVVVAFDDNGVPFVVYWFGPHT